VLRLEETLLVSLGGLLLLAGLIGLALAGYFDGATWQGNWRRAVAGGLALTLPLPAIVRAITWLAAGHTDPTHSLGSFSNPVTLPADRLLTPATSLPVMDVADTGPQWIVATGRRVRSHLRSIAVTAGLLAIPIGTLWYWYRPSSRRSVAFVRNGIAVLTVVLLFSVVVGTGTWLATGDVDSANAVGSGRTGVTTSFESGTMQGWSVEEGTASVTTGPEGPNALHIDGLVHRSFAPLVLDRSSTLVTLDVGGPATVNITTAGEEVVHRTVDGTASWRVSAGSTVSVRVSGRGVWLHSARIRPVLGRSNRQKRPAGRGMA
jgi:hypothetical protein